MTKRQLDAINRKLRACRRKHDPQYIGVNFFELKKRRRALIDSFLRRRFLLTVSELYDTVKGITLAGPTGRLP